jgi:replicative DNA helicase
MIAYGRDFPDPPAKEILSIFTQEPIPLCSVMALPEFPLELLPRSIGPMAAAVAEMTQTDAGMPATSALAVLAAAVGGRAVIDVRPGWREGLNLFTVTVAGLGERKSAVQAALTAPLRDAELQLMVTVSAERLEADTRKQIALKVAERARLEAGGKHGDRDKAIADAIAAAELAEAIEVPKVPRILADDTTVEALASLMAEQDGRIAVVSAEGGIFDVIAGRYSNNVPSLDVFLKGHAGDALRVDRKGRPPEYVEHPALTMALMIQPEFLAGIGANHAFRGRGLLARNLYCLPVSRVGSRKADAPCVSDDVSTAYRQFIVNLVIDFAGWKDPAVLTFDDEARTAVIALGNEIEPQLVGTGALAGLADWGAKYVGAVCRIAGLLHLAEHGVGGHRIPVTAATFASAAGIGAYYKEHAIAAFTRMRVDQTTSDAEYLLGLIRRSNQLEVSTRDLFTAAYRGRFRRVAELDPAIAVLVDHGWLVPEGRQATTGRGRPPSPRWHVHPSALSAQSAQR